MEKARPRLSHIRVGLGPKASQVRVRAWFSEHGQDAGAEKTAPPVVALFVAQHTPVFAASPGIGHLIHCLPGFDSGAAGPSIEQQPDAWRQAEKP